MAPRAAKTHEWTNFEKHALLCLMVRGIHITGMPDTADDSVPFTAIERKRFGLPTSRNGQGTTVTPRQAHAGVASMLNVLCHSNSFQNDIPLKAVSDKIVELLGNKAAIQFMERNNKGRLTKAMRQVWNRGLDFDGSQAEWEDGRKSDERLKQLDRTYASEAMDIENEYNDDQHRGSGAWVDPASLMFLDSQQGNKDPWGFADGSSDALQDQSQRSFHISGRGDGFHGGTYNQNRQNYVGGGSDNVTDMENTRSSHLANLTHSWQDHTDQGAPAVPFTPPNNLPY